MSQLRDGAESSRNVGSLRKYLSTLHGACKKQAYESSVTSRAINGADNSEERLGMGVAGVSF